MHTVDDYAKYRTAHRDGMAIRQIARTFHVSRRTVREALASPEPKPYTRTKPPPAPVLGPFTAIIDRILRDDRDAPPKQRHTAAQLFRRLQPADRTSQEAARGLVASPRPYVVREVSGQHCYHMDRRSHPPADAGAIRGPTCPRL